MANTATSPAESRQLNKWQSKLLPWMILMPTVLIAIFIYLSTKQLSEFNASINTYRTGTVLDNLVPPSAINDKTNILYNNIEYIKLYARVKMEERALDHRYAQTGFLLIARTYTKYLGFFTGIVLAIVAAVFIISKLKEDTSDIGGTINEKIKFRVVSSSPGIIFGLLGTALMMTTILYNPEIGQTDAPLYLTPDVGVVESGVSADQDNHKAITALDQGEQTTPKKGMISSSAIKNAQKAKDSAAAVATKQKIQTN